GKVDALHGHRQRTKGLEMSKEWMRKVAMNNCVSLGSPLMLLLDPSSEGGGHRKMSFGGVDGATITVNFIIC
ncbi:hypothetical protein PIB30_097222, partial [Stylosanthes scabra]|nr:hypothetical protein [Stylosanthes scabra]